MMRKHTKNEGSEKRLKNNTKQNTKKEGRDEALGGQEGHGAHRRRVEATIFLGPAPPKGSNILEKAAMLAADCRLQDWKDWRIAGLGSNTLWGRRIVFGLRLVAAFSCSFFA